MGEAQEIPPSKGVPERQRGRGMLVRLLGKLFVKRINIPLRRFAFATHRCPPSKGRAVKFSKNGRAERPSDFPSWTGGD